jgi:hypothetical protein
MLSILQQGLCLFIRFLDVWRLAHIAQFSFPNYHYKRPTFNTAEISRHETNSRLIQSLTVSSSCATSITPACLQELYGIPIQAANSTTNQLVVTGYDDEIVNRGSLEVSNVVAMFSHRCITFR